MLLAGAAIIAILVRTIACSPRSNMRVIARSGPMKVIAKSPIVPMQKDIDDYLKLNAYGLAIDERFVLYKMLLDASNSSDLRTLYFQLLLRSIPAKRLDNKENKSQNKIS